MWMFNGTSNICVQTLLDCQCVTFPEKQGKWEHFTITWNDVNRTSVYRDSVVYIFDLLFSAVWLFFIKNLYTHQLIFIISAGFF